MANPDTASAARQLGHELEQSLPQATVAAGDHLAGALEQDGSRAERESVLHNIEYGIGRLDQLLIDSAILDDGFRDFLTAAQAELNGAKVHYHDGDSSSVINRLNESIQAAIGAVGTDRSNGIAEARRDWQQGKGQLTGGLAGVAGQTEFRTAANGLIDAIAGLRESLSQTNRDTEADRLSVAATADKLLTLEPDLPLAIQDMLRKLGEQTRIANRQTVDRQEELSRVFVSWQEFIFDHLGALQQLTPSTH